MRSCSNRAPLEPLTHLCFPPELTGVEVSSPKTINIKQYLNTNNFSSNFHEQHNPILQNIVIEPSVKLRQSNIKLLNFT
jgi:hypothetical protein